MSKQLLTIVWAQWRILRNHLPRTTVGSLLSFAISVIWYGGFTVLSAFIAVSLPVVPLNALREWLGLALFAVFIFWQLVPLMTLTGGWSLDLKRLQVYPLSTDSLLAAEVMLRITAAGEMVLVLLGGMAGLALNPAIHVWAALALLLFIPFNLFVSLTIRDLLATAFQTKSYVREVFAVLVILVGVGPQFLFRFYAIRGKPLVVLKLFNAPLTPWHAVAAIATGQNALAGCVVMAAWIAFALGIARWQFLRALKSEELLTAPSRAASSRRESTLAKLRSRFTGLFPGATGILLDKELRSLVRMPRFRVVFLLACVFSVIVFLPLQMQLRDGDGFFARHGLQVMNLYGLLILSDVLLWNVFGFDRSAAQIYFVTPVDLASVIRAKNVTAGVFMAIETLLCVLAALLFRVRVTPLTLISNLCGAGVATLLFLCIGNISSVSSPRAADPKATLRKQNNGMVQLWLLGCTVCAGVLLGAAYLAGWAMDSEWAAIAVLGLELGIGAIAYRFSVESAVARLTSNREAFLSALDKSSSPVSA